MKGWSLKSFTHSLRWCLELGLILQQLRKGTGRQEVWSWTSQNVWFLPWWCQHRTPPIKQSRPQLWVRKVPLDKFELPYNQLTSMRWKRRRNTLFVLNATRDICPGAGGPRLSRISLTGRCLPLPVEPQLGMISSTGRPVDRRWARHSLAWKSGLDHGPRFYITIPQQGQGMRGVCVWSGGCPVNAWLQVCITDSNEVSADRILNGCLVNAYRRIWGILACTMKV